jgi:hypothetical protein
LIDRQGPWCDERFSLLTDKIIAYCILYPNYHTRQIGVKKIIRRHSCRPVEDIRTLECPYRFKSGKHPTHYNYSILNLFQNFRTENNTLDSIMNQRYFQRQIGVPYPKYQTPHLIRQDEFDPLR